MTDELFAHMLKLSTICIPTLKGRTILDEVRDMTSSDIHNAYNIFEIIADTFVEIQKRLEAQTHGDHQNEKAN